MGFDEETAKRPGRQRTPIGRGLTLVWLFDVAAQRWGAWAEDDEGCPFTSPIYCDPTESIDALLLAARERAWRCHQFVSPGV